MQFLLSIVAVLTLATIGWVNAGDQWIERKGGSCVKAFGLSGKIYFSPNGTCNAKGKFNGIVIDFRDIQEIAADGRTVVGTTGRAKHSFNTFASQDFRVNGVKSAKIHRIDTDSFNFISQLKNLPSTLTVNVSIAKSPEGGNVTTKSENLNVQPGDLILFLELTNWKFCGTGPTDDTCKKGKVQEIGAFVDFTFYLTSPKKPVQSDFEDEDTGLHYKLDDKLNLALSQWVVRDGAPVLMADGYPKYSRVGSSNVYTLRFNRFAVKTTYVAVLGSLPATDVGLNNGGKNGNKNSGEKTG